MNCDEVRALAASYALDALPEEERAEVERHLSSCDLHDDIAELRAAALSLSSLSPEVEPSDGLERRILDSVRPRAFEAGGDVRSPRSRHTRWSRVHVLVAALGALVLLLGAMNVAFLLDDDASEQTFVHLYRLESGTYVRVETNYGQPGALVSLGGFEPIGGAQTYQMWAIRDEQWLSIGTFRSNDQGEWSGSFDFTFQQGDVVAVTVEPDGGSDRPTADPVVRMRL